jgi:peptidoglycan/xylan/chitin deacetylase (PgdA/CDA1 family)
LSLCLPAQAEIARPPQFVAIAFDNCGEIERWREWRDFAAEMTASGKPLQLTFFVSGINFLAQANRAIYVPPQNPRGTSRINFGGSAEDVRERAALINALVAQGHEIGSHAVGHFDGRGWSQADWAREFQMFDELFRNTGPNNGLPAADGFAFPLSKIVGFRAPYLATSENLYGNLRGGRFRYDTSGVSEPDAWPVKKGGIWRFNLANIRLNGAGRKTLSMDYNFLVAQSLGIASAANREHFARQMLQSYLDYFHASYAGNRAPIHIGHHFSDYQNGAYREALKTFARSVCGLPEVRCTTYTALADYMDRQSAETLVAYQSGTFRRGAQPEAAPVAVADASLLNDPSGSGGFAGFPAEDGALAGEAPVITGNVAALADDTVAGNDETDRVLADCGADGAGALGGADACGDVGIGRIAAHWDLEQSFPDANFEIGPDHDHP